MSYGTWYADYNHGVYAIAFWGPHDYFDLLKQPLTKDFIESLGITIITLKVKKTDKSIDTTYYINSEHLFSKYITRPPEYFINNKKFKFL